MADTTTGDAATTGRSARTVAAGLDVALLAEHARAFPTWAEAVTPPAIALTQALSVGSRMVRP